MNEHDEQSKSKRITLKGSNARDNAETIGLGTPMLSQYTKDNNIQTLIPEIDAKK